MNSAIRRKVHIYTSIHRKTDAAMSYRYRPAVYVASYYQPMLVHYVREALPDVEVIEVKVKQAGKLESSDNRRGIEEAEVLLVDGSLVGQCIGLCKKIKWIQVKSAGVEALRDTMEALSQSKEPPSFLLTRTPANGKMIGNYVITYILALERRMFGMFECQSHKQWKQMEFPMARVTDSLTVGVLGVGVMGREVAHRCKQFGMTVWGLVRSIPQEDKRCPYVDVYRTTKDLPELLEQCDYISSTLPSTPGTQGLLSGGVLEYCKTKKGVLISTGRGDVVNEKSLITAIQNQWLGGAVLDVTPVEPLPPDSPLWSLPNVYITPHISGFSRNEGYVRKYSQHFVENYQRFCKGEQLLNTVDIEQGY